MDPRREKQLRKAGVNIEDAMDRFMEDDDMLVEFLAQFYEDPNYGLFWVAMEEKRYEDAFKAVHNLKGLCGNLSLDYLFEIVAREVELLRSKQYEEAEKMRPEVAEAYEKTVDALAEVR